MQRPPTIFYRFISFIYPPKSLFLLQIVVVFHANNSSFEMLGKDVITHFILQKKIRETHVLQMIFSAKIFRQMAGDNLTKFETKRCMLSRVVWTR